MPYYKCDKSRKTNKYFLRITGSVLEKLLLYFLALDGLLLQEVEIVAAHAVHNEESDAHVPSHKHHPVHPNLSTHAPRLHLRLVVLREPLPRVELFDSGHRPPRGEVPFFDSLALEVFLLGLLLRRKEERGVKPVERSPHRLPQPVH